MNVEYTPYNHPTGVPFSQEAEEAVLGAVLVNPSLFPRVNTFLKAGDFYILRHAYIWDALRRIYEHDQSIDNVTLAEELRTIGRLSDIGGPAYITQLVNSAPSSMHAEVYGRVVERAAIRRRLLVAADEIKGLALDEAADIQLSVKQAYERLDQAVETSERSSYMPGSLSIAKYSDLLEDLYARRERGEMIGYTLPDAWATLRDAVPVVPAGKLVVVTGGTGGGKSAFMETWAEHAAKQHLLTEYIHTEMSTDDILHRRMARHTGLPFDLLATGEIDSFRTLEGDKRIQEFADWISYNYMPDVTFSALASAMRRAADSGTKVFFIDHFQDINPANSVGRGDNIVRALEQIVVWLNAFAEKRNVLVVVGSQQTKQGDTKWVKKLTEKAALWFSIRRATLEAEYTYIYNGTEIRYASGSEDPKADVVIPKARFGRKGKYKMFFHGPGFCWLDSSAIQRPAKTGKIVPFEDTEAARSTALEQL